MTPKLVITSDIRENIPVVYLIGGKDLPSLLKLNKEESEFVSKRLTGKQNKVTLNSGARQIHIVSVDRSTTISRQQEELRKSAYALCGEIGLSGSESLAVVSVDKLWHETHAFTEGYLLSTYRFNKYKTRHSDKPQEEYPSMVLLVGPFDEKMVSDLGHLCHAVAFTRTLVNEPLSYLTAEILAEEIVKEGTEAGFTVDVLNKGKIETLKMGGLLAVNRGSVDPPVFCILEWKPSKPVNKQPIVLVGKGVTYDTGGLNIKTGDYMDQMKSDMGGAAAVAGVLSVMARTNSPLHVIGLVPATDNRPGGNAYVQGDIITMFNGLTVEIVNTDAEGRLILADALAYSEKYNPALVIDVATLTGSAQATFGKEAIAAMGNAPDDYFSVLAEAGEDTYERIGRLPFWDEYNEYLVSVIADIRNLGKREAGAITAGKFLERFAPKPFIHLDIAGTAALKKDDYYRLKESTGSGVRLLSRFLGKIAEGKIKLNDL